MTILVLSETLSGCGKARWPKAQDRRAKTAICAYDILAHLYCKSIRQILASPRLHGSTGGVV